MSRRSLVRTVCAYGAVCIPGAARARETAPLPPSVQSHNEAVLASIAARTSSAIDWRWIVVHHTAAEYASLDGIDRYHRRRFGDPLGAEYHFVIGNGRKAPAGLIQPARWRHDARAAHLFRPERAPDALALCLVGNFEKRAPSGAEMVGLVRLTRALMTRFQIPVKRVTTHRGVDGRLTQCPGRNFPAEEFLDLL